MNNDNQIPELPKTNEEEIKIIDDEEKQEQVQEVKEEVKQEPQINKVVEEVKQSAKKELELSGKFIKDVRNYLTTKNSSELFALFLRVLLIVGFIIILYFPFQMIMDIGVNFFAILGIEYTTRMAAIWGGVWNILYSILALVLFYVLCRERFYKLVSPQKEDKKIIAEENK